VIIIWTTVLRPHSIILASCKPGSKPGFRPGLQPGFRQVLAGLRHAFDTLSTFLAAGLQQVRWFVRVLDKWNVEKTRFEPANEPVEAGFSLRILLFVLIMT